MIRNSTLIIFTFMIFLLLSVPVLAQSNSSDKYDDWKDIGLNSNPNSQSGAEMQNNPAVVRPNNPAMVNPSDPTRVNSNTPSSTGIPPSISSPGMNPKNPSNVTPPSGH